jgi:6-pyruvoyltetrahydropterin/6-carboxytetrahydropterin synthase
VEASVRGAEQAPVGWVADLASLDAALKAAAAELDHTLLNDHPGLESPTLEHLCLFFAGKLKRQFPGLSRIVVSRPSIGESCSLTISG